MSRQWNWKNLSSQRLFQHLFHVLGWTKPSLIYGSRVFLVLCPGHFQCVKPSEGQRLFKHISKAYVRRKQSNPIYKIFYLFSICSYMESAWSTSRDFQSWRMQFLLKETKKKGVSEIVPQQYRLNALCSWGIIFFIFIITQMIRSRNILWFPRWCPSIQRAHYWGLLSFASNPTIK